MKLSKLAPSILVIFTSIIIFPPIEAEEKFFDLTLAKNATVVLRVKLISVEGADKYAFYKVNILSIYKNAKNLKLPNPLIIVAYSWKAGVPQGESTVYLEQYGEPIDNQLRLINGDAETGVSHIKQ